MMMNKIIMKRRFVGEKDEVNDWRERKYDDKDDP